MVKSENIEQLSKKIKLNVLFIFEMWTSDYNSNEELMALKFLNFLIHDTNCC